MNKKFIALSMLMFASWSNNVVSSVVHTPPVQARSTSMRTTPTKPAQLQRAKSVNNLNDADNKSFTKSLDESSKNQLTTGNLKLFNEENNVQLGVRNELSKSNSQANDNLTQTSNFDASSEISNFDASSEISNFDASSLPATSYYDRAAQFGEQAKSAAYKTGKYLVDAPGIAFKRVMGGERDFISNPVNGSVRSLAFGRSQILTPEESIHLLSNNFENVKPLYNKKDRLGNDVSIFIDNDGNRLMKYTDLTQKTAAFIYTPATAMNLPARTIAALYDKLPTLSTQNGRQEFKANVSAMLKRAGNDVINPQKWNEFFASMKPNMSFPSFDNLFSNLFGKKTAAEQVAAPVVAEVAPAKVPKFDETRINIEVLNPLSPTNFDDFGDAPAPDFTGFDVKKDIQPISDTELNKQMAQSYAGSKATIA